MNVNRILMVGFVLYCMISCPLAFGETPTAKPAATKPTFREEKFANGNVKSHYTIDTNGIKSGEYNLFTVDGKLLETGTYKNGQLDGPRQAFYPNGNLKISDQYHLGKLDGNVTEYDDSKNKFREAQYANGVLVNESMFVEGIIVYPRTPVFITSELKRIKKLKIETQKSTDAIPAHEGGNESQEDRENAVRRLMEYRFLSFVPHNDIVLDPLYNAHDEAAAAILAKIGKLSHTPENPGWTEERYKFAFKGTSSSNIYMSSIPDLQNFNSVNAYMDDSDRGNIDRLGHRRWCLNPVLGKVGFATYKGYSAMWSMDHSRKEIPDFDFIACPAPGLYPMSHFGDRHAWSVTVNDSKYAKPIKGEIKVSITPVKIQLNKNKILPIGKPLPLDYENVDIGGYGISNCIIFRPANFKMTPNQPLLVEISGLKPKDSDIKPTPLRYVVDFYKL